VTFVNKMVFTVQLQLSNFRVGLNKASIRKSHPSENWIWLRQHI